MSNACVCACVCVCVCVCAGGGALDARFVRCRPRALTRSCGHARTCTLASGCGACCICMGTIVGCIITTCPPGPCACIIIAPGAACIATPPTICTWPGCAGCQPPAAFCTMYICGWLGSAPGWVAAHCTGGHMACALGVTAIEHVRDLWPMPPQTEQRCGLFLREEWPFAGRPSGPMATPPAVGTPDRARWTMFFVPCSWLIAFVSCAHERKRRAEERSAAGVNGARGEQVRCQASELRGRPRPQRYQLCAKSMTPHGRRRAP